MSEEVNQNEVQRNNIFEDNTLSIKPKTVAEEAPTSESVEGNIQWVEVVDEEEKNIYNPNMTIAELEKVYIINALKYFEGNKTKAANALGITIKTLYNHLHKYGMMGNAKSKN